MSDIDLDQLVERIDSLEDDLEAERAERRRLEDRLEDVKEKRRRLEEELEQKGNRIDALEERLEDREDVLEVREPEDGSDPALSDLWALDAPLGRLVHRMDKRMKKLERDLEDERPEQAAKLEENAPPIYDVLRTPVDRLKPTERRTRFLWADLSDYARKTPKGYVISASDAKRVLQAAEPDGSRCDRIDSKQVGRVFDLSETLTRGAAYVHKSKGERKLVIPTDWEDRSRAAVDDTAVS